MKVLIVDDDPDVSEVVSLCFEEHWPDASVVRAQLGEEAVYIACTEPLDIVILDIGLPDIDGFKVCSRIRSFSNVPIVMLTVRDTLSDIIRSLEMGADDYIIKPFRPAALLARVNAVLRRVHLAYLPELDKVIQVGTLTISFKSSDVRINNQPANLGTTESQLFFRLVTNLGKPVPGHVLIEEIWGQEYRDRPFFLATSLARLEQKLKEDPRVRDLVVQNTPEGYSLASKPL